MKIGVLLSGCGMYDGTEVSEAVLVLLALDRAGAQPVCLAPDADQFHSVDHLSGEEVEGEVRSSLRESARIARGKVTSLGEFWGGDLQGLVIPGGYGVPKTLMTGFMSLESQRELLPEVRTLLDGISSRKKPVAAVSLGRSIVRAYFGEEMSDKDLSMPATEVVIDHERCTLFTPGFLTATRIDDAARGIDSMVGSLVRMAAAGLPVLGRGQPCS
jgi:enhancing lycopene biosynthesis protein 2